MILVKDKNTGIFEIQANYQKDSPNFIFIRQLSKKYKNIGNYFVKHRSVKLLYEKQLKLKEHYESEIKRNEKNIELLKQLISKDRELFKQVCGFN